VTINYIIEGIPLKSIVPSTPVDSVSDWDRVLNEVSDTTKYPIAVSVPTGFSYAPVSGWGG